MSEQQWDQAGADPDAYPPGVDPYPPEDFGPDAEEERGDPMDEQTRELLQAIHDAMENPSMRQRFRIAEALRLVLAEGSMATPQWAAEFIRRGPREEVAPTEQR